jgi:hypothetical protein
MNRYGHMFPNDQDRLVDRLDEAYEATAQTGGLLLASP